MCRPGFRDISKCFKGRMKSWEVCRGCESVVSSQPGPTGAGGINAGIWYIVLIFHGKPFINIILLMEVICVVCYLLHILCFSFISRLNYYNGKVLLIIYYQNYIICNILCYFIWVYYIVNNITNIIIFIHKMY